MKLLPLTLALLLSIASTSANPTPPDFPTTSFLKRAAHDWSWAVHARTDCSGTNSKYIRGNGAQGCRGVGLGDGIVALAFINDVVVSKCSVNLYSSTNCDRRTGVTSIFDSTPGGTCRRTSSPYRSFDVYCGS